MWKLVRSRVGKWRVTNRHVLWLGTAAALVSCIVAMTAAWTLASFRNSVERLEAENRIARQQLAAQDTLLGNAQREYLARAASQASLEAELESLRTRCRLIEDHIAKTDKTFKSSLTRLQHSIATVAEHVTQLEVQMQRVRDDPRNGARPRPDKDK